MVLRGTANAGDLLAFYPGTVFLAEELRLAGGNASAFKRAGTASPDYLLARAGGMVVDALQSSFDVPDDAAPGSDEAELLALITARDAEGQAAAASLGQGNAWANGHFINHPPKDVPANVIG